MKQCLGFTLTITKNADGTLIFSTNCQLGSGDFPNQPIANSTESGTLSEEDEAKTIADYFEEKRVAALAREGLT